MKRFAAAVLSALILPLGPAIPTAQTTPASQSLQIWVVDVEGGKAALYVAPTGQSLLIDTGFPGVRDHDRIMAAIADSGIKQLDYLLSTHYHVDHIGGVVDLARSIPIATYVDHGPTVEGPNVPQVTPAAGAPPVTKAREQVADFQAAYAELYGKARHLVVKPGDRVPITGIDWRIVTAGGMVLKAPPLPGGGDPNPDCAGFTPMITTEGLVDPDDEQSVGSVGVLGQFRVADFGDMWRTKELELMCPNNPIGTVDLMFASSHGAIASGSLPFVHGMRPRVVLIQNGTRKGGAVDPVKTVRSSPGLEDLWQMHWSYNLGTELNSAGVYIANVDDPVTIAGVLTAPPRGAGPGRGVAAPPAGTPPPEGVALPAAPAPSPAQATPAPSTTGPPPVAAAVAPPAGRGGTPVPPHTPAYWLKITALADGSFTITNTRNGFSKRYAPRSPTRPGR
jgi:beta-lactamase superfamily II metal-dependent hydrolase